MLYNTTLRELGTEKLTQGYFCEDDYIEICCDLDTQDNTKTIDNYVWQLFGDSDSRFYNTELVEDVRNKLKSDYTLYICKFDCDNYITYNFCHRLDYCKSEYLKKHLID